MCNIVYLSENKMNQAEFFRTFDRSYRAYNWSIEDNRIVGRVKRGPYKGWKVNPITAVARSLGKGFYEYNELFAAAKRIGLTEKLTNAIQQACIGHAVNGHAVVVKGKILRSVCVSNNAVLSER